MRIPRVPAILLLALAAACGTSRAAGAGATADRSGAIVEGRVEDLSGYDGTLTIRSGDEVRRLLVAPEAEVRIDDFEATFQDIQEGQRVRAALDESGAQPETYRIEILDQGVKAPADTAPDAGAAGEP